MAVKKSAKSALDYDPLSWLKGEETESADLPATNTTAQQADDTQAGSSQETGENLSDAGGGNPGEPPHQAPAAAPDNEVAEAASTESELPVAAPAPTTPDAAETAEDTMQYLHLDPELTMKNVAEFKEQLDQLMQQDSPVAIDADELRKIDSAGLQLLYSLQKSLAKNGASIHWKQPNEAITAAAAIVGMEFDDVPAQQDTAEIEAEQGFGFF